MHRLFPSHHRSPPDAQRIRSGRCWSVSKVGESTAIKKKNGSQRGRACQGIGGTHVCGGQQKDHGRWLSPFLPFTYDILFVRSIARQKAVTALLVHAPLAMTRTNNRQANKRPLIVQTGLRILTCPPTSVSNHNPPRTKRSACRTDDDLDWSSRTFRSSRNCIFRYDMLWNNRTIEMPPGEHVQKKRAVPCRSLPENMVRSCRSYRSYT